MATVHRLDMGHVELPESHPRAADGTCPIFCFAVTTHDGTVVVDTGPRAGHPFIDELYAPQVRSIVDVLNGEGIDERHVLAIVNTHLHFDHCGQNYLLGSAPVWVTDEEVEAATAEFYTVPEWAEIPPDRRRRTVDGELIAPEVRLLHTPGHTPGHQSVCVDTPDGLELIVGQTCFSCAEFEGGPPAITDMHDESWLEVGQASLDRLRSLSPAAAHFSHDLAVFGR